MKEQKSLEAKVCKCPFSLKKNTSRKLMSKEDHCLPCRSLFPGHLPDWLFEFTGGFLSAHTLAPQAPSATAKDQGTAYRKGDSRRVPHTPKPCASKIVFKGNSGSKTEIFHHSSHSLWAQQSCASRPRYAWHMERNKLPQALVPISDVKYFFIPFYPLKGLWSTP